MHGTIKVKSPNNTSKWQMGFNSAFKWLIGMGRIRKEEGLVQAKILSRNLTGGIE
jgi:hypothetical protein